MSQFILFLRKIYFVIMFILLEIMAFSHFSNSSVYANAKIMNASAVMTGGFQGSISRVENFMRLRSDNEKLLARVAALENELETYKAAERAAQSDSVVIDPVSTLGQYEYMTAHVVNNTINRRDNYLTIDKGSKDGVVPEMAIMSNGCLVGYIVSCSAHYSVGVSFLNTKFVTSGQSTRRSYYGSVRWEGVDYSKGRLLEIPKYADIEVGDTIVTTEFSSRFPEGIPIGVVTNAEMVNGINYEADIDLLVEFGRLYNVELVKFSDTREKLELERSVTGDPENMTEGEILERADEA